MAGRQGRDVISSQVITYDDCPPLSDGGCPALIVTYAPGAGWDPRLVIISNYLCRSHSTQHMEIKYKIQTSQTLA